MHKFRKDLLRFLTLIFACLFFTCFSSITVFSATKVDFTLSDCNTDNNRLFTISMSACYDSKLSAASFEFTYDKNMFEFRSAKVSDKSSKITYNELDDKVILVFLNADGISLNNDEIIFSLTFKAVKSGTGYIDFFVSDCVNSEINSVNVGKCTSAKITVNSKLSNSNFDKNNSSDQSDKKDLSGVKSKHEKTEETTSASTYDEIGQLNSFDNPNTRLLIIGTVLGASLITAIVLAYNIFKRIKSNIHKHKNSPE